MPANLPSTQDYINNFLGTKDPGNNLTYAEIYGVRARGSDGTNGANPAPPIRSNPTPRVNPDKITTPTTPTTPTTSSGYTAPSFEDPNSFLNSNNSNSNKRYNDLNSYAQSLTDSINAKYSAKTSSDKEYIAAQDARARVLNTRTGNTDSGTGAAAIDTVQKKGNALLAADEASKNAEIGIALGKIDTLRSDQANVDRLAKQQDLTNYNNARARNSKTAEDSLKSLAANGVDAETLKTKEPDTYSTLQKVLGYSDLEMTSKINSYKTTPTKFQYKVSGDTVTAYGVDKDGKLVVQDQTIPGLSSGQFEIKETKDGSLYKFNKTTGEITPLHGAGPTKTAAATSYSKNQETDAKNWLALQPGFDQNVDMEKFDSDPTFKAWAIQQALKAKPSKTGSSSTSNPFSP